VGTHVIGLDVGSQSVKGVLCSPDGAVLATAAAPCTMIHPASGWSEQDPADWRRAIASVTRQLLAASGVAPADVGALGLACQVDGVVPLDGRLDPLAAAIIWLDRRAGRQARRLAEQLGEDRIFGVSGLNCDSSHSAPKIMWLHDESPEVFDATHEFAPVAGYLAGWLTGRTAQDHANASSSLLYDVSARDWSDVLLDAAGLTRDRLTPIRTSSEIVGTLLPERAAELGLTSAALVVTGTGDDHAAALAAGVVAPGPIADVTGTAEPVAAAAHGPVVDPERLVETHAHAVDGGFLIENPGFVSGGSTRWLADLLHCPQSEVFDWAAQAPPISGVVFVPALSGACAPRWNDEMRGVFSGLSMHHDHTHLARAVLEGCCFALRDIVVRLGALGLGDGELRVVGGGSRSELWLQMKADVTGLPVRRVDTEQATALGAAMVAAVGAGGYADLIEATEMAHLSDRRYEPDAELHARYDDAYAGYRALFDAVEGATT
jgi:xylulokinase